VGCGGFTYDCCVADLPPSEDGLRPPTGLKAPGRRLWVAVAGLYVLTPAELEMLGQACRTSDELDRLEKAVRQLSDLTVRGSTGQPKAHPLLEEVRRHRVLLERLTGALNLPDEDEEVGLRPGQKHGRRAINARWKGHVPNGKLAELRAAEWGRDGEAS
jgi:hypothetical protein